MTKNNLLMKFRDHIKNMSVYFSSQNIFLFLGVLIIFFVALKSPTDPDMGWHLADGKYLLNHHLEVARYDIFSHSMADFPLIMHEWITDIWMFAVSRYLNLFILSIIFAIITTFAFLLATLGVKAKLEYKVAAAILAAIASIPVTGVRPQMITLLGLALVIYIVFQFRKNPDTKIIYFLPLIFWAWVNFHGGFAVGLFFIAVFLAVEAAKRMLIFGMRKCRAWLETYREFSEKNVFYERHPVFWARIFQSNLFSKFRRMLEGNTLALGKIAKLGILLLASILATLANPYGWRVYIEVITTIFDKYAKQNIGEWLPVTAANPMSWQFLIYLTLLGILLLFSWHRLDYTYFLVALPFLYLGFTSWRHMPVFLIISTPFWVYIVETITGGELEKIMRRKWFLALMVLAVFLIARQQIPPVWKTSFSIERLARDGGYPIGAVKYIRENSVPGNMFNEYNWGGFLIWQLPEKKVFIDGRMPSWRVDSFSIFEEFNNTVRYNEGWEKTLEKYNIGFAVLYGNWLNDAAFSKIGWKKVYSDNLASVYQKP